MADFNKILDAGNVDDGIINVVNEIPQGSSLKVEWNRQLAVFQLDRQEPRLFAKPVNYGFIPQTLDGDGDELDVLIYTSSGEALPTGLYLEGRIIGILNFEDDGEMDHKVVVVPADDRHTANAITSLDELGEQWKKQIEHHFNHYKDLKKPGTTKVLGWGDSEEAKQTIKECIERWQNR